jgi:hypothetical protein
MGISQSRLTSATTFLRAVSQGARLARDSSGFIGQQVSAPVNHKAAIALFVAAHNFCKVHSMLGTTPAHAAKITDGAWTMERLIEAATI